jgi:hypothetical protein
MPNLVGEIRDFVSGDDLDVWRTISEIPTGQILSKAWFTVKTGPSVADVAAIFQKTITTAPVTGQGAITDTGADTIGRVRFELTHVNTALLSDGVAYYYDIQVLTDAGKIYTPERGLIKAKGEITKTIS